MRAARHPWPATRSTWAGQRDPIPRDPSRSWNGAPTARSVRMAGSRVPTCTACSVEIRSVQAGSRTCAAGGRPGWPTTRRSSRHSTTSRMRWRRRSMSKRCSTPQGSAPGDTGVGLRSGHRVHHDAESDERHGAGGSESGGDVTEHDRCLLRLRVARRSWDPSACFPMFSTSCHAPGFDILCTSSDGRGSMCKRRTPSCPGFPEARSA